MRAEKPPDFERLCALEPGLGVLEERARAANDDGSRSFYCSNFVWLPLYTELRSILGAYRRPAGGEEPVGPLFDSLNFERAFDYLSGLLPPCRDCGCRTFEPVRGSQLREVR